MDALPGWPEWVEGQPPPGLLVFGVVYTLAVLLFVPGAPLTLLAGGLFGVVRGTLVVAVATSVADAVAFLIGRYLARAAVERLARRSSRFAAFDAAIAEGGWRVVALLRLSPTIPYSASNYLYGLTAVRFLPYWIASGLFTLPGIVAYTYLGYVGAASVGGDGRSAVEWGVLLVGAGATVSVTVYVGILTRRALDRMTRARN